MKRYVYFISYMKFIAELKKWRVDNDEIKRNKEITSVEEIWSIEDQISKGDNISSIISYQLLRIEEDETEAI